MGDNTKHPQPRCDLQDTRPQNLGSQAPGLCSAPPFLLSIPHWLPFLSHPVSQNSCLFFQFKSVFSRSFFFFNKDFLWFLT